MKNNRNYKPNLSNSTVLLLGDGLFRGKSSNWKELLRDYNCNSKNKIDYDEVPNNIAASLIIRDNTTKTKDIGNIVNKLKPYCGNYKILRNYIIKNKIDTILTTNYTYDVEHCLCKNFRDEKAEKVAFSTTSDLDKGYNIHVFNRVNIDNTDLFVNIWHIHGEKRKPKSIVFDYRSYITLTQKINGYYNKNYNKLIDKNNAFTIS